MLHHIFSFECSYVQIIYSTEDMIPRSLWEAVNTRQPNLEEVKVDFLAYSQVILLVHHLILFTIFCWQNKAQQSFY